MKTRRFMFLMQGRPPVRFQIVIVSLAFFLLQSHAFAIERTPSQSQIEQAINQGVTSARERVPPNQLYAWFGSDQDLEPKGFLMTKMNGLVVMACHFGLRGETPGAEDIQRVLDEETMLVSVTMFGSTPAFAKDSYIVLKQGDTLVKPVKVRFDAVAHRTQAWPNTPRYQAKVIGSFNYDSFDPKAKTSIIVFPSQGGEKSFEVVFSNIP